VRTRTVRALWCGAACVAMAGWTADLQGQADTVRRDSTQRASTRRTAGDSAGVQGGIYNRPFIGGAGQTSIGGYAEGNTNYFVTDGVTDGFTMELRRFNIFLFSAIGPRLRFISELEFEHGTEEIALETALLDFQLDPALVLRAGILLPPVGAFNQNHDSPRWEFVDRPLVSTRIIPSTLSEVGFGAYGRLALRAGTLTYDAYLSNGLGDGVVHNSEGRTLLAAGKRADQFEEDNNGSPAISGRLAFQRRGLGEIGVSYYGAVYNSFRTEGVDVDARRRLSLTALDVGATLGRLTLRGETAVARVDVPESLAELFGHRQWGAHLDAVMPIWYPRLPGMRNAVVNAAFRTEYVDYNVGRFGTTGRSIRDDVFAVVPGVTFRPAAGTVFKANYRREWSRDLLGNAAARTGGYQVGVATYF
jgi:hypothetical protein